MAKTKYTAQEIIELWHRAMRINPDLVKALRECRAAILAERARREAGAGGEPGRVVAACARWLSIRFSRMWGTAPALPLYGLQRALDHAVVAGAWEAAREPLLEHVEVARVHVVVRSHALGPFDYSTAADDTVKDLYDADPVVIEALLPRRGGFSREDVHRQVERGLDQVEKLALVRPPAGDHGAGRLPDWANDVTLYRLWRQYEEAEQAAGRQPEQAAFVDDVTEGRLPVQRAAARLRRRPPLRLSWLDGQALRSVGDRLTLVKQRYGPDPNTPPLEALLKNS